MDRIDLPGALPLVIALGGHRDLREEDVPELEVQLGEILAGFRRRYPHSPLIVLSSLAEGADRLGARVILAQGLRLVAPLPLRPDEYERDFDSTDSRAEFANLLSKAEEWFVVPSEPGDSRERRYARTAAYMAQRSQVVIALWDGHLPRSEAGTAQLVRFALDGVPEGYGETRSALDTDERRPVIQIATPRQSAATHVVHHVSAKYHYPAGDGDAVVTARTFREIWQRTDDFNRDATRLTVRGGHSRSGTRRHLLSDADVTPLSERIRAIHRCYGFADALSMHFQQWTRRTLRGLLLLVFVASGALQLERLRPQTRALSIIYFAALASAYGWWLWSRRARFQTRHLDYRALAEGLRVQFFWQLAGLPGCTADHYLRKQRSELDWIRRAMRAFDLGAASMDPRVDAEPLGRRLQLALEHWVRPELDYFARAAAKNDRQHRTIRALGHAFFAVAVVLAVVTPFRSVSDPLLVAVSLVAVVTALAQVYADRMALAPLAKQYRRLSVLFTAAQQAVAASVETRDYAAGQRLLRELATEVLTENGDWVLLHRERPVDVPRLR